MARILLVEDEVELAALIREALEQAGHHVLLAFDGPSGLLLARQENPDLIILDLRLPGIDGLDVLRALRRELLVPVLILTARGTEFDRVLGLELGADDYVVKPFSLRELVARVRALLRRLEIVAQVSQTECLERPIRLSDLVIDPATREVWSQGRRVHLTAREFALLWFLAANPGRVFSREYLLDRVWGPDFAGGERTVDAHIARIRKSSVVRGRRPIASLPTGAWDTASSVGRASGDREFMRNSSSLDDPGQPAELEAHVRARGRRSPDVDTRDLCLCHPGDRPSQG